MKRVPVSWLAAMAAVSLGVGGCQPQGGAASSAAASGAASSAAGAATAEPKSQTGETPSAFVARLMAPYQPKGQMWGPTDTPAAQKAQDAFIKTYDATFYDPSLQKLMDDNTALAEKADGPDLDYDPICQCQDSSAVYAYAAGKPDGAHYDVSVTSNDKEQGTWTFVLADSPSGWRVYNVLSSAGDLRAKLTKDNACLRAAKTMDAAGKCEQG
ncbi:MAG TPA: hypothetical protein VKT30_15785 [Caulobacteraceae bacterium]|nr:hypothetical protein [Caulobacteraceae bacterium]